MHSNIGNGVVSYLSITAKIAAFALACTNAFNTPANPGATPILLDPPPKDFIILTYTCAHAKELRIFNEYYNVEKACKKIIFTLITEAYYHSFKNKHTRFATVSCLNILTRLWTTYGTLKDYEVQQNDEMTKQTITADTLFKDFVE